MGLFSVDDQSVLSGPHVQRVQLAHVSFPSGERRLHTGMGPFTIGGHTWEGVSDPFGGQLVGLTGLEEPRFGRAVAVDAVFSGANRTFLKSIWDDRHAIEGVSCDLHFAVIDAETGDVLVPVKRLMRGKLSAPRFSFVGSSIRAFTVKIVSIWEGLNFAVTGSMWSPAGQRARYPGDKGMDLVNAEMVEIYK
jgi:nitrite reductase/ring-hydroxylating ferredoxin subunit